MADPLQPIVYAELHRLAQRLMHGERGDHTLQPTALLHEAYLRLVDRDDAAWRDRAHFVRTAARAMRQVLVDHARRRQRRPATSGRGIELAAGAGCGRLDVLVLDETLARLAQVDPQLGDIVELRVFGGLDHQEIAAALSLSLRSTERAWALARAWLNRELGADVGSHRR